ncbi:MULTISPECIES: Hsp20/alpha crystallin family protein [Bacillota]|jgi:HSP20 family protein|uniref:Hsp20/alpha crystallin family protein n=3 Tax=Erysipelotrichaceae TaxID=128827 RepID=A0A7G9GKB7_9FIRM|nr:MULTISPECIES: Hsp20/alpha crystallin family protein [Bacillota]QNM11249.1 Hsp20/alpha crystallin family protein [[Eubacterium] hominis]MCH4284698.1 Hsp20/alpha crystallin family protein [Amedibacillus hominis]RGB52537.1 Hsp20/alpha crystallin family protein [Absiella sp. AM22-9]RGB54864.1 Hsp20/alpha crystallin family protein [Absiella sp. AM10-20]RGB68141.1 Hsp20/alpha crystallin family protein [Absiella sp. AM09-45]
MMRLFPGLFNDAFDDMMHDHNMMKTDIREKDGNFILDMELPGFKKEDIQMELKEGYLTINASRNTNKEDKDDEGNIIRQERFSGTCTRSFYVGEDITHEDIKASFGNGELKVIVPKEAPKKVEEKRFIPID